MEKNMEKVYTYSKKYLLSLYKANFPCNCNTYFNTPCGTYLRYIAVTAFPYNPNQGPRQWRGQGVHPPPPPPLSPQYFAKTSLLNSSLNLVT